MKRRAVYCRVSYNRKRMTKEEQTRLYELVQNPPPGSKIEAARKFGIDLTLNLRLLRLTPTERVEELESALEFVNELQRARKRNPQQ